MTIAIIGGGAAGFFCAIRCAALNPSHKVIILEKTAQLLTKVKISGGGRCNVTHACFNPLQLTERYPRGSKALRSIFARFQPQDTIAWFAERGVALKTERDGRMFPETDESQTIVTVLLQEAQQHGVEIRTQSEVTAIRKENGLFSLTVKGEEIACDKVMLASGGVAKSYQLAAQLGHKIVPPVPSLFTFNITDPRLEGLSGLVAPHATASIVGTDLKESGPLLITHWGVSGPVILRLSAWGARILHEMNYEATLIVNWLGDVKENELRKKIEEMKRTSAKKTVQAEMLVTLPKNLWRALVAAAEIPEGRLYAQLSQKEAKQLIDQLLYSRFQIKGKSTFKEEFVTCGGIPLDEVNFQTMESKICSGLYFAGEVLDIDGITGGFNFQNAWSTGWIAAQSMSS